MPINFLNKERGFAEIDRLAESKTPFLFIISYDKNQILVEPLDSLSGDIAFTFDCDSNIDLGKEFYLKKEPIIYSRYLEAFNRVLEHIKSGDSYLLNLTFRSTIETNLNLEDIFAQAKAPYKLLISDYFVCFSPECFITIKGNTICTFPMKGTIDGSIEDAKNRILNDIKESAEHTMIVDLMRNDLNMVAVKTKVLKFRYIDKIRAGEKELLQVSSKIEAILPNNWHKNLGRILDKLTPAGSITGTPKLKTREIIDSIEPDKRALYCGVFGIYDGKNLQSAVMIRAISKDKDKLYYHSGGGITIDSNPKLEYQELIDKIYLPI